MALLDPNTLLALALAFVLGISVHEFAHAYVAYQMGDMTPVRQGRVTLNPAAHMTLWGTLLIFLIGFGWGKPVQHRIWDPKQRLWVSLAGPVANLLLAFLFGLFFRFGLVQQLDFGPDWFYLPNVLFTIVSINVLLALFNLIPLSPLDGSSVFAGLLPDPYGRQLAQYNAQYPQALIVFLLVDFFLIDRILGRPLLWTILGPPISFLTELFTGLPF
ncbi:MAG: site-2 protease family protein [Chloroflexota bacterium]|nr:site-2 protease family protein [Chloroflexota bacterium]